MIYKNNNTVVEEVSESVPEPVQDQTIPKPEKMTPILLENPTPARSRSTVGKPLTPVGELVTVAHLLMAIYLKRMNTMMIMLKIASYFQLSLLVFHCA